MPKAFKLYLKNSQVRSSNAAYWQQNIGAVQNNPVFPIALYNSYPYSFLSRFLPRRGTFLDLGCGSNQLQKLLSNEERSVVGMDFVTANFAAHSVGVAGNMNRLPFQDACVDGAFSLSSHEHLEEGLAPAFRETFRVLRPGGCFLLLMPGYSVEDPIADFLHIFRRRQPRLIPHLFSVKEYVRTNRFEARGEERFFAYWYAAGHIKKQLRMAGFQVSRSLRLGIKDGLVRSRLMRRFCYPSLKKWALGLMRRAENPALREHASRHDSFFLLEDCYGSRGARLLHQSITRLFYYLNGFVCVRPLL